MKNVGISATRALVVHNVLLIVKSHVYHSRFINFFYRIDILQEEKSMITSKSYVTGG
jgi:hypothetical protein